jgi:hypothetical protein
VEGSGIFGAVYDREVGGRLCCGKHLFEGFDPCRLDCGIMIYMIRIEPSGTNRLHGIY